MIPLNKALRGKLEKTIKDARDSAEDAARAALEQLGVGEAVPFAHLCEQERDLRRRLRVHGRQLGDSLNGGKIQTMDRLIEEVAYEHWHRMLFARFLAENNLLMYPDPDDPVAVTLEECEDLAAGEGAANGWELAARFAARMLPQIFRLESPVFKLVLPPEHQQKLERLVADLPLEVFTASDSLGWVYQFWQADNKEKIKKSEVKIGARELPAVTQLFTEPYMVSFLLDNSLGAWWAARRLTEADLQNASSEEELRRKAAIPGVPLDYLRFVQQEDGSWTPAAGTFDGWPDQLADLKTLDPCCGSGHFLVAAFLMLVPMRMKRDGLSAKAAVAAVLRENIHGLELDQRCVELAAFALALTAWKYPSAGGYRLLPELNVACSGLSISAKKEEWLALSGENTTLRQALGELYKHFSDAPVLGSLINPESSLRKNDLFELQREDVQPLLARALEGEPGDERTEMGIVAQGLAKAADLLSDTYHWVVTNVPYLARGKQDGILRSFCEQHYPEARNDLATVFLDRCLDFCSENGTTSIVLPQNWLFLTSYKKFREKLLKNETWHLIARLGPGAFETISGEVVKAILITLSRGNSTKESGGLFGDAGDSNLIRGVDVSEPRTAAEKAAQLLTGEIKSVEQAKQLENPDARVALEEDVVGDLLNSYAHSHHGLVCGDRPRMCVNHWELEILGRTWIHYCGTVKDSKHYGGKDTYLRWCEGTGAIKELKGATNLETHAWEKKGIVVSAMRQLPVTFYTGMAFDNNTAVIVPSDGSHLPAIWCFCSSPDYNEAVRQIDQSLKVTNATLVKVPFDLDHWTKVAEEEYPNGLPKPYTDDPTQWIFHGHPCGSVIWNKEQKWTAHGPLRTDDTVLHVAVARLLGYRWPAELDTSMELADEQREWVKRCGALAGYADDDGIVCIPPVRGEASASDRLLNLLAAAYGDAWSNDTLAALLKSADHAGKTIETWLREKFFTQHCKLFQHRPFIWHIWDGLQGGFAALVNYHKLDAKRLETLIYTYLGDWVSRQTQDIASGVDGAQERLDAAEALKKKLELILEGEAPYDIFVRWKPLEKQPIGWDPDLNDGVRLNIRPFLSVPDVGKKGAGVLRDKPNINWNKDRGKDVESAPWYPIFKGERINDHHLSIETKLNARKELFGRIEA
ncbi:Eco57I restriction-modification methylase domain-containing protein [Prosthecochloris sp. CIB 2401]|uniref:Eco57I restriction-modification methylase domain-containing protein n=1 Tax=Prosthecochloris sp. CIB 2401 TaxID=1868325 RepID=UPI00080AAF28|nr:N-6 DNA methylase [Prosthecochloris sp. CIB 2401]ANT65173.1 type II restriction m6 adenine DNA methyltransferase, Alw26I/Eco31I/Esp3I family [Prosthecochloris sp. CIB 2401]